MSVVAKILRAQTPSWAERISAFMPGYQPDTTYPEELDGGYHTFSDPDELRDFLRSGKFNKARSKGAQITLLQLNGTSVWIKYPRGSVFYQQRVLQAIQFKNSQKRKKIFFVRLAKMFLKSLTTPKQNPA